MLVELLQPLGIVHVGLAARDILDVARVHQQHLEAAGFEDLEDRNPVHARRLHGDRRDADLPSSQSANRWRSPLNVRKVRTGLSSRSPGTATTWNVEPTSMPAASGLIVDSRPEDLPRVFLLPGMRGPPVMRLGSRGGATDHFPKRDRLTASPLSSAQATPGPCFFTGSRRHH